MCCCGGGGGGVGGQHFFVLRRASLFVGSAFHTPIPTHPPHAPHTPHRGEIDLENPLHEQEARRLFEGMLQALQDVSIFLNTGFQIGLS